MRFVAILPLAALFAGCGMSDSWNGAVSSITRLPATLSMPKGATVIADRRKCLQSEDCQADAVAACRDAGYTRAMIVASASVWSCRASNGKPVCADKHALDRTACW
jgi:hypothetical protein